MNNNNNNNEQILTGYLLQIITEATEILKDIDVMDVNNIDNIGAMVTGLHQFHIKNYVDVPF